MIQRVRSDHAEFKTTIFKPGLNVILAERTKESAKKDSRNGLGKSALIEIIHFCLGSATGETLSKPELNDWTFTLDMDVGDKPYSISRNTSKPSLIEIKGDCANWAIKPDVDEKTGKLAISPKDLRIVLGQLMFGLPSESSGKTYQPTFGSLISYFARRNGHRGGFLSPFENYKNQLEWDIQVNNSYLLGLAWEFASKWQTLKDRGKVINQIKKEIYAGTLSNVVGNIGELEARRIRLKAEVDEQETQLQNFKVLPQYEEVSNKANSLTHEIHELVNKNVTDNQLVGYYEDSLREEVDADADLVIRVYEEAGVVLHENLKKNLEDLKNFHKQVVANRKDFLSNEISRLRNVITKQEEEKRRLVDERAKLMMILKTHGALEEYTLLQKHHQDLVSELNNIESQISNLARLESGRSSVIVEQELLQRDAQSDLKERHIQKEAAVLQFNRNSEFLYKAPGTLSINLTKTGYKFGVNIERAGSHGIGNMEIFCYDIMLAQLWSKKTHHPGFLIHDSILFADVDERQVALAIELAAQESNNLGFQYICTLNSDNVPYNDFGKSFNFEKHVCQTLTDATEDGCLFGVRF